GAIAVCLGGICGPHHLIAITLTTAWAFAAGFLVALSNDAADLGAMSLVTLVVFTAQPMTAGQAVGAGFLALGGGLLQCLFSLALWPMRQYEPVRRVLAEFFTELGAFGPASISASAAPPATDTSTRAHNALEALASNRSVQAERYRSLQNQAERIRLSLMVLARLRARLERDSGEKEKAGLLDQSFELAARVSLSIGMALAPGAPHLESSPDLDAFCRIADTLREAQAGLPPAAGALVHEAVFQLDALAGQFRSSLELAEHAMPKGLDAFAREEIRQDWGLRLSGTLAILRANLTLRSTAFRHAIRLAACVAAGDTLGRSLGWQRSYWVPMTVAIVLKPDFGATFSRGVLRLLGTFTGLVLSTALFHVMPDSVGLHIALITVMMFLLRSYGPAHYGFLVVAVTALVVLLFAISGVQPAAVMAARGLNTAAGGLIALVAYWLWPTWERTQVSEAIARLLDAYRVYFNAVRQSYIQPDRDHNRVLGANRVSARLARSNLEASFDRFLAEPGASQESISLLNAILASSHRLVHAVMALEAGLARSRPAPARLPFGRFADDAELTLYYLAAILRGSALGAADLPELRAAHRQLLQSGDSHIERYALVNTETDRITNSLNTLSAKLFEWLAVQGEPAGDPPP
ncbi:MAG: FUSC family protein, partial [Acidobacteria bacterium]|nr:FUSC family protein [Acidobacteriota bacterium]